MRILYTAVALVASLVVAFAADIPVEEDVYVLGDDTFKNFVAENEFVLAEFYAPWCGHCKSLAPEYAKAASQLKEEGSDVKLTKIDSTIHKDISKEYGVRGYPTLKFFRSGDSIDYTGGRQAADIIAWLKKKTGPSAESVDTVEQHKSLADKNEVYVIGLFDDKDSDSAKAFLSAAASFDEGHFAISTSKDVKKELDVTGEAVILLKHFDDKRANYDGKFTKDAIVNFVKANNMPLVLPFNQKNQPKIFGGEIRSHMMLFITADDFSKKFKECYTEAAKAQKEKMLYITVDIKDAASANVMRYFHVKDDTDGDVRLITIDGDMIKYVPTGKITCDTFTSMAEDFFEGKLTPHYNSEEVPEDWNANPVKVLVGKNFKEVAYNKSATVFVKFYAPWCGHCKTLVPIWDELADAFKDRDDIVIAKMDSTANEVPDVNIQGFPTLKLFMAESNEVVEFKGDRTLVELKKFVLEQAGGKDAAEEEEASEEEASEEPETHDEL